MIATIARFEAGSLLRSAVTWVLAAVIAVVFAFLFLQALETYLEIQPQLAAQDHPTGLSGFLAVRYLSPLIIVLALIAPLLAMKSFSDDYRQQTMALWQSSPVSSSALVVGKFLGVFAVIALFLLLALAMPLIMRAFTPLDAGILLAAALGLALASSSFAAIGLFFSSLTRHPVIAVAGSVLLLLLLWLIGSLGGTDQTLASVLGVFSVPTHLAGFFQGYMGTADIAYFLVLTALFLTLTIVRLDALRHSGN